MDRILAQEWEEAFVFFKHEDQAKGPEIAMRFRVLADSRREDAKQNRQLKAAAG